MTEPARSAVREEGDVLILQTESLGGLQHFRILTAQFHALTFSKVVSTTVGTKLLDLLIEHGISIEATHLIKAFH